MEYDDYICLITNGKFKTKKSLLEAEALKISFDDVDLEQQTRFFHELIELRLLNSLSLSVSLDSWNAWDIFEASIPSLKYILPKLTECELNITISNSEEDKTLYRVLNKRIRQDILKIGMISEDLSNVKKLKIALTADSDLQDNLALLAAISTYSFIIRLPQKGQIEQLTIDLENVHAIKTLSQDPHWSGEYAKLFSGFNTKQLNSFISSFHEFVSLKSFSLINANIFQQTIQSEIGRAIKNHPQLTDISINLGHFETLSLDMLHSILENPSIKTLSISDFSLSHLEGTIEDIKEQVTRIGLMLKENTSLKHLILSAYENEYHKRALDEFIIENLFLTLLENRTITLLDFDLNNIFSSSASVIDANKEKILSRVKNNLSLASLNILSRLTFRPTPKNIRDLQTEIDLNLPYLASLTTRNPKKKHHSYYIDFDAARHIGLGPLARLYLETNLDRFRGHVEQATTKTEIQLILEHHQFNALQMALILYNDDLSHYPFIQMLLNNEYPLDFSDLRWVQGTKQPADNCTIEDIIISKKDNYFPSLTFRSPHDSSSFFYEKLNQMGNALKLAIATNAMTAPQLIIELAKRTTNRTNLAEAAIMLIFSNGLFERHYYHFCNKTDSSQLFIDKRKFEKSALAALQAITQSAASSTESVNKTVIYFSCPLSQRQQTDYLKQIEACNALFSRILSSYDSFTDEEITQDIIILITKSENFIRHRDYYSAINCSIAAQLLYTLIATPNMSHHLLMTQTFVNNILALKNMSTSYTDEEYSMGREFLSTLTDKLTPKEVAEIQATSAYQYIMNRLSKSYVSSPLSGGSSPMASMASSPPISQGTFFSKSIKQLFPESTEVDDSMEVIIPGNEWS